MSNSPNPLQTLYRTTVMAGTLAVGTMVAYLYGPPPERLAGLINSATATLNERFGLGLATGKTSLASTPTTEPALVAPQFGELATLDPMVRTASAGLVATDPAEQLRLAGATDASVTSWGSTGALYRAEATLPTKGGNLVRRLDAIAETPEQAANRVLAQIERTRR